jgi:hypothetical protein
VVIWLRHFYDTVMGAIVFVGDFITRIMMMIIASRVGILRAFLCPAFRAGC